MFTGTLFGDGLLILSQRKLAFSPIASDARWLYELHVYGSNHHRQP